MVEDSDCTDQTTFSGSVSSERGLGLTRNLSIFHSYLPRDHYHFDIETNHVDLKYSLTDRLNRNYHLYPLVLLLRKANIQHLFDTGSSVVDSSSPIVCCQ
jgi:hypothetical protein